MFSCLLARLEGHAIETRVGATKKHGAKISSGNCVCSALTLALTSAWTGELISHPQTINLSGFAPLCQSLPPLNVIFLRKILKSFNANPPPRDDRRWTRRCLLGLWFGLRLGWALIQQETFIPLGERHLSCHSSRCVSTLIHGLVFLRQCVFMDIAMSDARTDAHTHMIYTAFNAVISESCFRGVN